ncbi:hypothetical protein [Streptomyces sp. NPDC057199]|uniref:hypothetical protein n=1 Tax=Streptomyces sp. NPDC057199 TaxID=3346047 RepID=UPI0036389BB8
MADASEGSAEAPPRSLQRSLRTEHVTALTPEEIQTLVDFEQQIQWRWSSGDPTGYIDALAENVTYFDPFTVYLLVGR